MSRPAYVEFKGDVSNWRSREDRSKTVEDLSNYPILVNRNCGVTFGRRHIVIEMDGIGTSCL